MSEEVTEGLGRRDVLKRGALIGGAVIWTTPVVQSLAGPAFAAGSPAGGRCLIQACVSPAGVGCGVVCYQSTSQACCDEAARIDQMPTTNLTEILAKAAALLAFWNSCGTTLTPVPCP